MEEQNKRSHVENRDPKKYKTEKYGNEIVKSNHIFQIWFNYRSSHFNGLVFLSWLQSAEKCRIQLVRDW